MNQVPIHKFWGTPLNEWIERIPNELPRDAVGLRQIVLNGRYGFELNEEALIDFIRCSLLSLFASGAMPVIVAQDGVHFWTAQTQYGNMPEVMADRIITKWLEMGGNDPDESDLWFALPEIYESTRQES